MKATRFISLPAIVAALACAGPAQASTDRTIDASTGVRGAHAFFVHRDGSTCTRADIYAERGRESQGAGLYSFVFFGYAKYADAVCDPDTAAGAVLASGGTFGAPPASFQVTRDLTSAGLTAAFTVTDEVSGQPTNVALDLNWAAKTSGPLHPDAFTDHFNDHLGFEVLIRGVGAERAATVSGDVLVGGEQYAQGPLDLAEIQSLSDGIVMIERV